jgi:hypothetical protein
MWEHCFCQKYPAKGVPNICDVGGCFKNVNVYCGMAFDKKKGVIHHSALTAGTITYFLDQRNHQHIETEETQLNSFRVIGTYSAIFGKYRM